jgi:hypothetical protein
MILQPLIGGIACTFRVTVYYWYGSVLVLHFNGFLFGNIATSECLTSRSATSR